MANNYITVHLTLPRKYYASGGKNRMKKLKTKFVQVPIVHHLTGTKRTWAKQLRSIGR